MGEGKGKGVIEGWRHTSRVLRGGMRGYMRMDLVGVLWYLGSLWRPSLVVLVVSGIGLEGIKGSFLAMMCCSVVLERG